MIPLYLPGRCEWASADSAGIKHLFGLDPRKKWPPRGMDVIEVAGWRIWVISLNPFRSRHSRLKPHRAMGECPSCKRIMSLGRVSQHVDAHIEREERAKAQLMINQLLEAK